MGSRKARVSAALYRRPLARAALLLTPPLAWFLIFYLASLVVLLITGFWRINAFTTNIERVWNLDNFKEIFGNPTYRGIMIRTILMASGVTIVDAIVAFPFAYYMARVASPTLRTWLFVMVLLPLWASYLARVYAWLLIFTHDGILNWTLGKLGLGPIGLAYTNRAVFIVFCYIWLPFMVIPVNSFFASGGISLSLWTIVIGHATFCIVVVYNNMIARLRRTSPSLFEAAMDLGAHGWTVFRTVTFPLLSTAFVAGALLAFALSFDEVVVTLFTAGAQNTLPLWIFGAISRGQQLSEVNAVVFFVIALTIVPITIATRLTGAAGVTSAASRPTARS